jgi:hypothetical protein
LGKSGNTARINVNSNTNITGALTIFGPITLGGNITSGGAQAYHGDVTVSGGNQTLSGANTYTGPTGVHAGARLNLAAVGSLAASSAAMADVVILSTPGRDAPPQALHEWTDRWFAHGINSPSALFTLFGDHLTPVARSTARTLLRKTSPLGIDFFMHPAPDHDHQISLGWQNNDELPPAPPDRIALRREHESAFDTIESFAAHLRALFLDLAAADLPGESRRRVQAAF